MVDWKKIGNKILYPHPAVLVFLTPISVACLIFSLIFLDSTSILAILSYILSFYVLLVFCFKIPNIIKFCKRFKNENKYAKKYFSDVQLRMNISLYGTLIFNIAFAIFQLWLGFKDNSLWFYAMFVYYVMLSAMRFFLLKYTRKNKPAKQERLENQRSLVCGWMLLLMNLALSVIVFFIVYLNQTFEYHMITTIALAAYTFLTFTFAIINIVKYKKYNSPVYSSAKTISLISASVSMLTLTTTMLNVFGDGTMTEFENRILLSFVGSAVSIFAITMSILMIVKGRKKLRVETRAINLKK